MDQIHIKGQRRFGILNNPRNNNFREDSIVTTKKQKSTNKIELKVDELMLAWLDEVGSELGKSREDVIRYAVCALNEILYPCSKLKKKVESAIQERIQDATKNLKAENVELKKRIESLEPASKKRKA